MFDFDTLPSRRGTAASKWSVGDDELPMWVADMDFPAAAPIKKALQERLEHGIFGYDEVPDAWYEAYIGWWQERHGFLMDKEWLIFCTGVIPALSSAVRKLTTPNEKVLIQTPVYNIFFNSIVNNGCRVLESRLLCEDGKYRMDIKQLKRDMADPQCSLMILCNPHNPCGNIWDRDTLAEIGRLALENHVVVISDEIHCDITRPGSKYVPFASVSDECRAVSISCFAPSKAFNLAGLHSAAVCVPDQFLRHKIWRALNTDEVAEPNSFACPAAIAAFNEGGEWLDALRGYVFENRRIAEEYIKENLPELYVYPADATYLCWIDVSKSGMDAKTIRHKSGLFLSEGTIYGSGGEGFVRMNLACSRQTLMDGLNRLRLAIRED